MGKFIKIAIIVAFAVAAVLAFSEWQKSQDSETIADIAEDTCGEGQVKTVTDDGFTCAD